MLRCSEIEDDIYNSICLEQFKAGFRVLILGANVAQVVVEKFVYDIPVFFSIPKFIDKVARIILI